MLLPRRRRSAGHAARGRKTSGWEQSGMLQNIEYARRKALEAREKANECVDNRTRSEWEKAARMWEQLAEQYELLRGIGEKA